MLYSAICGYDSMDATSKNRTYDDFYSNLNPDVKGKTIGIPEEYFSLSIDEEVRKSVENAIKVYEGLGCNIKKISLPNTKHALAVYYVLASAEASSNLGRFDGIRYGFSTENPENIKDVYFKTRHTGIFYVFAEARVI